MIRRALLTLAMSAAAAAQTAALEGSSTTAMLAELARLEPAHGWASPPPGVADEQWGFYRRTFGVAPEGNEPTAARVRSLDRRLSKNSSCPRPTRSSRSPRRAWFLLRRPQASPSSRPR